MENKCRILGPLAVMLTVIGAILVPETAFGDRNAGSIHIVEIPGAGPSILPEGARLVYASPRRVVISVGDSGLEDLSRGGIPHNILFRNLDPASSAVLPVFRRAGGGELPPALRGYDPVERVAFLIYPQTREPAGWIIGQARRSIDPPEPVRDVPLILDRIGAETVREIAEAVSADSLAAIIRRLSFDDTTKTRRTRFAKKPELERQTILYLRNFLNRVLQPAGSSAYVGIQEFTYQCPACQDTAVYTMENVVAGIRGSNPSAGKIVVGAHLDATAHFTKYAADPDSVWSWRSEPAPGADDNGSGVAAVLETARALAPLSFEFDVEFVLWDAEEIISSLPFQLRSADDGTELLAGKVGDGRWGSKAYLADAISAGEKILGVVNFDMIGYPTPGRGRAVDVLTNSASWWLNDLFIESKSMIFPEADLTVRTISPAPTYSDHAPFWDADPPVPAIALVEDWELPYPGYHTVGDTLGLLDPLQMRDVTRVVAALLARLATTGPGTPAFDISMSRGDLRVLRPGLDFGPFQNRIDVGDAVDLLVRARNMSVTHGTAGDRFALILEEESGGSFEELARWEYAGPFAFGTTWEERHTGWSAGPADVGEKFFRARLELSGLPDANPSNDRTLGSVRVLGDGAAGLNYHFAAPNPCHGSFTDIAFHYELRADSDVEIRVFNLEGEKLATHFARAGESGGSLGSNRISGAEFSLQGSDPRSGVFLYQIAIVSGSQRTAREIGSFALVR